MARHMAHDSVSTFMINVLGKHQSSVGEGHSVAVLSELAGRPTPLTGKNEICSRHAVIRMHQIIVEVCWQGLLHTISSRNPTFSISSASGRLDPTSVGELVIVLYI